MTSQKVMEEKARQAQIVYEELTNRLGIRSIPTTFVADGRRKAMFLRNAVSIHPMPTPMNVALYPKGVAGVKKLFEPERVLQTPAIAAVLAACSSVAASIGGLRGDDVQGAETYCDVAFAGMQAIRLFMADHTGREFSKKRLASVMRVNNAYNGSFHKYRAKDGRDVSFHVYYQSQQEKLVNAMHMSKPSSGYSMMTTKKDMQELGETVAQRNALEWEELAFDCGACGCMLRTREEWEATEVGKAVRAMPLIRTEKQTDGAIPDWGKPNSRGPLSGVKVLDLTHIIAGPACSRVLAEYGADVRMIRRGKYMDQEQAMLELDGWAGKNSIQLDFNIPEQLETAKRLIREADIITYSYQNGALDHFGLSEADIRALNPNVIYSNLMCFSDSVWKQRPGWAPCAEDITGLSVRNGSLEQPVNLNGVPLDYFPGFVLALGTLLAVEKKLREGGGYQVTTSLSRGAQYLHECTDLCEQAAPASFSSQVVTSIDEPVWDEVLQPIGGNATGGTVAFPGPGAVNTAYPFNRRNLRFTDGNTGWKR